MLGNQDFLNKKRRNIENEEEEKGNDVNLKINISLVLNYPAIHKSGFDNEIKTVKSSFENNCSINKHNLKSEDSKCFF